MKPVRLPFCSCRFTLTGLNLERFMNTLQKEGIPLLAVRRADRRTLRCECYSSDFRAIEAIAREKGWSIRDAAPLYLSAWLGRMRERPGVPIGAALSLILVLVALQFIWRVEIQGAGPYRAEIAAYLRQEGMTVGRPRASVDAAALERGLTSRYPEIAWFQVYVYNVSLVVECTRGVPMPALPEAEPGDIVAVRDGVVDSLRVYAGTPQVEPGDIVRKGQVLIRGLERGRDEQMAEVAARGVVTARCWRTHTVQTPVFEVESGETGRELTRRQLCTPWATYPGQMDAPPFLRYNTYVSLMPVGGSFFPLWEKTVVQREVWMERTPRELSQVKEEAGKAALAALKKSLRGYEIVDKWVDYCMIEDDTLVASATAEWLMDIGEPKP